MRVYRFQTVAYANSIQELIKGVSDEISKMFGNQWQDEPHEFLQFEITPAEVRQRRDGRGTVHDTIIDYQADVVFQIQL